MTKPKTTPGDLPVTVVALADLTPYPKNPRHITPAAVNAVAESLRAPPLLRDGDRARVR